MDSHFPDAEFFTEFEQFEAFVEDEKHKVVSWIMWQFVPQITFTRRM